MQHGLHGRAVAAALAAILFTTFAASDFARAAVEPIVPGFYRLRDEAKNANPAELGQLLVGELNCTACHAAPENAARVAAKGAPDLSTIGARATPQWIRKYLTEPHKVKPAATMPDLFFASEPGARAGAVDFLTHFLAAQGGPMPASNVEGTTVLVDTGRKLYHSVGCVACHAPEEKLKDEAVPSVPHGELASKYTVDSLAAFLMDPSKARPEARMPSLHLTPNEATPLAAYLLRDQLNNPKLVNAPPLRTRGLKYELYENTHFPTVELQKFPAVKPTATGSVDSVSLKELPVKNHNDYGVKFTGLIAIPRDGKYTFRLNSDDGSRLYIDDAEVINNDGLHSPEEKSGEVELRAGDHALAVTFSNWIGGDTLEFSWEGPGVAREPVPASVLFKIGGRPMLPLDADDAFRPDPQKIAIGGRMFAAMGCANCHQMEGLKGTRPAKPLAELKNTSAGCLAEHPAKGLPNYELSEEQRAFIGEALNDAKSLATPLEGESLVTRTLASMNCLACHKRGDLGGVTKDRNAFFTMTKPFDMGDEGKLPPKLTSVGNKLKPAAMDQIIFEGKLHVRRHHMATRMPQFVKAKMAEFVSAVQKVDSDKQERPAPEFTEAAARDGRQLVGIKGLGCINCHGVAGVPSMGMPALDLSLTSERLKPGWFHQLLLDPGSKNPGTRMPAFWFQGAVAFPDVAGGKADSQIDAIWTYLSLGKSMGLPAGMQPSDRGFELVPAGEPLVHRTFMKDVGPRAILVGSPDGVHVAFDADVVRLAKAWHGKFFDAGGMRQDRGGKFNEPLGTDVINLPPGPSFAVLSSPNEPWPAPKHGERNVGGEFKGYHTDKSGQVTFLYKLGETEISETPTPVLKRGGAVLVRKFAIKGSDAKGLTFLAATGTKIDGGADAGADGVWHVDGNKLTVRIDPKFRAAVRTSNGVQQLLIPVTGQTAFDVEMSW
jgi:mono/diheme cytochrome c family protein